MPSVTDDDDLTREDIIELNKYYQWVYD